MNLHSEIEYNPNAVVSKTLVKQPHGTITLFAFDQAQELSEHSAPFDAVVQVLDGDVELIIGGVSTIAGPGDFVIMPANIPHAVKARTKFKMLLTMIKE
ncbi:MAG: cupin domain-containing protein [bacterium]|nr:cupin domain-containing protein [bacterium]